MPETESDLEKAQFCAQFLRPTEKQALNDLADEWVKAFTAGAEVPSQDNEMALRANFLTEVFLCWDVEMERTLVKPTLFPTTFSDKAVPVAKLAHDLPRTHSEATKAGATLYACARFGQGNLQASVVLKTREGDLIEPNDNVVRLHEGLSWNSAKAAAIMHVIDSDLSRIKGYNMELAIYLARRRIQEFSRFEDDTKIEMVCKGFPTRDFEPVHLAPGQSPARITWV